MLHQIPFDKIDEYLQIYEKSEMSQAYLALTTTVIYLLMVQQLFLLAGSETVILGLLKEVLIKNQPYAVVFFFIILLFAGCYTVLGNAIGGHPDTGHGDGNPYVNFGQQNHLFEQFIWSYMTAIGSLEYPNGSKWNKLEKFGLKTKDSGSEYIPYMLWLIWMIQQYFMLFCFLNILIAVIS